MFARRNTTDHRDEIYLGGFTVIRCFPARRQRLSATHCCPKTNQRTLVTAREDLDLTELLRCLEHWRRVALLQRDPARFASIVRRAAERLTDKPVPADEPLTLTRRHVGL